jgi:hypothetical protein
VPYLRTLSCDSCASIIRSVAQAFPGTEVTGLLGQGGCKRLQTKDVGCQNALGIDRPRLNSSC